MIALCAASLLGCGAASAARLKTAVFAGGCFWSMEKAFEATPGVTEAVSGYAGGTARAPTYEDHAGYLEAVKVTYDPDKVSYGQLVSAYFHHTDPTDGGGQFCDRGESYRPAIFVADAQERAAAEAAKAAVGKVLGRRIATAVRPASSFYPAETYHQDFARLHPARYEAYRIGCGRDAALRAVWAGR